MNNLLKIPVYCISEIEDVLNVEEEMLSTKTCECGRMSICGFDCETEEPNAEASKDQDVSDKTLPDRG